MVTSLRLGDLGYGGANLGNLYHPVTDDEAWQILEAAWECGIRYYDTAPHYGLGLSERRLGAFLATRPRDQFVVSTKVGRLIVPDPRKVRRRDDANLFAVSSDLVRVWDVSEDGVRRSLEESLQRLGLDSVDVLYLHDPEEYRLDVALRDGLPALARLREERLVTAVGVGSKSTDALLDAARSGMVDLLMAAGRYTLLEQPLRDAVLPECHARGIGIVAAAVFNSGLLATDPPSPAATYEYRRVPDEVFARAERIAAVCAEFGVPLPAAALRFPLREPAVRSVVVGGASADQVRENAARMRSPVPDGLWHRLREEEYL